jgi:MFS transporter, DHA2 family, multidrug resistance protein
VQEQKTLVIMRSAQTAGLAILFMPMGTITYATVPRELDDHEIALFIKLGNVFGSIGISVATAMTTERSQVHQSYLAQWASAFHHPFNDLIARYEQERWGTLGTLVMILLLGPRPRLFERR